MGAPCGQWSSIPSSRAARAPAPAETGPVDAVIDLVGGEALSAALTVLRPGGHALAVGMASQQPTTIDFEQERRCGGRRSIDIFTMHDDERPFAPDLADLVALLDAGELEVPVGWQGSWHDLSAAYEAMAARRVHGKAIAHTDVVSATRT